MSKRKRSKPTTTKASTLLDIVICVYGRFDLLSKCLASIPEAAGNIKYNIILVDNNSPEQEVARTFYDSLDTNITVIRNKENLGFPRGCNIGARRKTSPLLFMLNSDVILEKGSIDLLVRSLDDPTIGVAGMKLLFPSSEQLIEANMQNVEQYRPADTIQHIGLETNISANFIHIFVGWSKGHPKVNVMHETYAVTGAALMTRRLIWQKLGGFYEGYGHGTFEDVDFCLSARALGYNVIVVPKAVGTHYVGATAVEYNIHYPLTANRFLFMQRWGDKLNYTEWQRL